MINILFIAMDIFNEKCSISPKEVNGHQYNKISLLIDEFNSAAESLSKVVPGYYIDPKSIAHVLKRLGKVAAAEKIITKIPETKKARSGDLGEILATEYIESQTEYTVPIRKLRWKDHREMPMRGEDVIGIQTFQDERKLCFLKTEAKSRAYLDKQVVKNARNALDSYQGKPAPHALAFVCDRLREEGNFELADMIDDAQLKDHISSKQVNHMLFVFVGNDPDQLLQGMLTNYEGGISQNSVGLKVDDHQKFIQDVFDKVKNGLNT